jgi:hypothetical protein
MASKRGTDSLAPKVYKGQRKRIVYVFSEGKVTEPSYIEIIKEQATWADSSLEVDVHIANANAPTSQRKPLTLVEDAVRLMREKTRQGKRSGVKKAHLPQVWCLFDRDQHEGVDTALKLAREGDIRVAFSHPCFEVWRLLHIKPVTGTFGASCAMAEARLPFAKSVDNIKVVLPGQIPRGSFLEAKKRALKMNDVHEDHVPKSLRDPYTDVFSFVEDGLGIVGY